MTRKLIEKEIKNRSIKHINKIITEGGVNSSTFWKIRKRLLGSHNRDEYDTKDEDGNKITNPTLAKEHIATYYEDLYQAREGEDSHAHWTEHINRRVAEIDKDKSEENIEEINSEEINGCISKLRRNKSTGPDDIPNEAFIEANQETRELIRKSMNNIYNEEKIPDEWQSGEVIRLYKGKGEKGKCSNERGITLASNAGKLFERIINNRITPKVKFTEAQEGGQKGKSTADHILILNSIIKQHKQQRKNKNLHIAFLDVTKAYDKAWLNAILYVINKNGLSGKNWRILKNLNSNLKAKIRTKFGMTREINVKDSIRQGGVLSVVEYANLIDEIAKQIKHENTGKTTINDTELTGCLLWMDDIALIHHDDKELQKMLNITEEIAKRYHIKFSEAKSQTIAIGKEPPNPFNIAELVMDHTKAYKYLGVTINNKGNMEEHIKNIKGKTEAAGMWDVETMMQEKQILYLHKILKENDNSIKKSIATNVRNHWHKHICKALEPAKISMDNLAKMSKSQARTTVKKALSRLQMAKIKTQAQKKSKLGHLLDHQNEIHIGTRPHYMETLNRNQCANIFSVRSRMIKTKNNYKSLYIDMQCRWCKQADETQKHLLTQCPNVQHLTTNLDYNKIMGDNQSNLRMEATIIQALRDHISNTD